MQSMVTPSWRKLLVGPITLTAERLQETMDDMVRRGRMTRHDAEELLAALVHAGRSTVTRTRDPIPDYDELKANEVPRRLAGLTPAQLKTVREHEASHANRRTVLAAIDRRLR